MNKLLIFHFVATALALNEDQFVKVPYNKLSPRIINGDKAEAGQFPWQVAIFAQAAITQLCGGALISDTYILTAAHCVQGATNFSIRLGSTTLTGDDPNRITLTTTNYIQHEDYNRFTLQNDVAVIVLNDPIPFSDYVKPIKLASNQMDTSTEVTVSGWGLTKDGGGSASNDLNYVSLVTISYDDCNDAYGGAITDGVVCAQSDGDVVKGTCEGDSGGPLVIAGSNSDEALHVGIVSFGHTDGCESGKPAGFARTDFYRDWIQEKTGI